MNIERVVVWDARIELLVSESRVEGFRFLERLRDDWQAGANRFDRPGEALFIVIDGGQVMGVGGVNRENAEMGRLRRVYVTKAARRAGIGKRLVQHALDFAKRHFRRVVLRTDTIPACDFYLALGFSAVNEADFTHAISLANAAPTVTLGIVTLEDFDALADLRVAAMRESLERVGRFDSTRARERLRSTFSPEHTRSIDLDGERVGFYAMRPSPDGLNLDHLYIHPRFQSRGIGGVVLKRILAEADRNRQTVRVGALKESASNRFYERHGFVRASEGEWDNYYTRAPLHG